MKVAIEFKGTEAQWRRLLREVMPARAGKVRAHQTLDQAEAMAERINAFWRVVGINAGARVAGPLRVGKYVGRCWAVESNLQVRGGRVYVKQG